MLLAIKNAVKINVGPGGKQLVMKDTVHNGVVQRMVNVNGISKVMKMILEERGIVTKDMNAKKMRETLGAHSNFVNVNRRVG